MRRLPVFLFASFAASRLFCGAFGAEAFLKPNDVIALVGGEDMVAAAEYGYLELLLTRALPDHRLKFRCLAWEGDTVFEQRRDLNFPTWEEQLEKIGATVILCQFGQMESLAGEEGRRGFIDGCEKLIGRFSAGGKRRIVVVTQPRGVWKTNSGRQPAANLPQFSGVQGVLQVELAERQTRDGIHASAIGHMANAFELSVRLASFRGAFGGARKELEGDSEMPGIASPDQSGALDSAPHERLRQLIIAKNELWNRYWRVQNWAFLAGDRTTQASSRDHLDPTKRWFPAERELFLPLIEKKEQEIWGLAAKLR